jgi:thiosulfate/3-mercaptopyruvate sulfurtransferase
LLSALLLLSAEQKPADYARPELLIDATDLVKEINQPSVRVLDCRAKSKYLDGHIPGAVWVDVAAWMRGFGEGRDREGWARRIGALGIDTDTRVVVYDDSRAKDAARIWWILRYWGVRDVRLLNGGWGVWASAVAAVQKQEIQPAPVDARLRPQQDRLATRPQVADQLGGKVQIVDARSSDEYCGKAETAKRNGAIPGAVNLDWSDLVDSQGRFKSAAELARLFQEAGIDPARPTITYCQSGGRASVMAFVLELMGGRDVRNYYRSWSEWGNAEGTPIVKPKPKKDR